MVRVAAASLFYVLMVRGRATSELAEPFWLPTSDEPRHFSLLYRYSADADTFEFKYGGVSVNRSLTLSQPLRLNGGK